MFVNKIENTILSGNIVSDISDHFSQFCIIQSDKYINYQYQPNAKIRDYSKFSESKFNDGIARINWYTIIANKKDNIDKLFITFYDKLNNVINKHAPLKPISNRMKKQFSKPWITKGIRKSIKIKNKLFHSTNKNKYKLYRNKITTLTRISKNLYYNQYFNNNIKKHEKNLGGHK